MSQLMAAIRRRLHRKLVAVAPIVTGALLLVLILSLVVAAIEPHLPATYRALLHQLRSGEWAASRASLLALFDAAGEARGFVFLVLQIGQVLVAPIPGHMLALLGGALFGFWHGLLLTMVGLGIGTAIAMTSSRVVGDALVRRCVPAPILARFDHLTGTTSLWSFFLIFLLPAFPDDAVCFMAGLTRIPLPQLLLVSALGRLPGTALLSFVGADGGGDPRPTYVVLGVAMVLAFGIWLWSDELEAVLRRIGAKHGGRTRR